MTRSLHVVAFAGSLREGSYNEALLRAARRVAPAGLDVEVVGLDGIPLYDADLEADGDPEAVSRFKRSIRHADALLIATPEYQHGVSGVLKNALDWASRPPDDAPLDGKPVAIMGATPGAFGTARAQEQLRTTLVYNDCPMVNQPEVLVAHASDKVDEDGEFTDEETLRFVRELLDALSELVERARAA